MTNLPRGLKLSIFGPCLLLSLPLSGQDRAQREPALGTKDKAQASGALFPDWPADAFDFRIGPIIGGRARQTEYGGVKYDSLTSEIGLGARVLGIPLIPSNPGITLEPYATYTWGNRTQKVKGAGIDETDSTGFQRHWYGAVGRFYYAAFRYSLDLGQGKINYDDSKFIDVKSRRIVHDLGVLVLPFLSGHYTLTALNVDEEGGLNLGIKEMDHWVHARMAFSPLNFYLDLGPGRTHTRYSGRATAAAPLADVGTVNTTYLKALTSLHLFWKLGASGSARYILSADESDGFDTGIDQLPNESLSQNRSLAVLPKGSLEASLFFGLRDLFAGFGVGWQIYYLELNNDDNDKQISRDQGFVVNYETNI